jgi:hypothetical protein
MGIGEWHMGNAECSQLPSAAGGHRAILCLCLHFHGHELVIRDVGPRMGLGHVGGDTHQTEQGETGETHILVLPVLTEMYLCHACSCEDRN